MILLSKKLKTFLTNSIILIISSILFRIFSIFFNSYITQKIGKELLGLFNLVLSVYIFGITLANFGVNFSITRLVSEELAIGNKEGITKMAKRCIIISFACGILASSLFFLLSKPIVSICLHNKVDKNIIYLICIALPFISMSSTISGYFVAIRRVYKSTIAQFFEQIIKILITSFLLNLFLPNGLEYACFSLILGDLISEIFSFIFNYILYLKDSRIYKTPYTTHINMKYYDKKIFEISVPIAITSFIRSGLSTIKQIIIPVSFERRSMNCNKALSIYGEINGMAMPVVIFPNMLFSSISGLFIPEFATYNAQKRYQMIKKITTTLLSICILISFIISISLFLFADSLSSCIYNDTNVAKYIKILSPISLFILLDCVIDNILKGLDAQNDVMLINIIDLFINIILIYWLVPKFNINGYILSMYFSEIFNLTLSARKLINILSKYPIYRKQHN